MYPWDPRSVCAPHLIYFALEIKLLCVIVPLFLMVYRHCSRLCLILLWVFFVAALGIIPTFAVTLAYKVDAFPNYA